jgi:hypothetical protein
MILIKRRGDWKLHVSRYYGEPVVNGVNPRIEMRKLHDDYYVVYIKSSYDYKHFLCDTFTGIMQIMEKMKVGESCGVLSSYLSVIFQSKKY